MTPSPEKTMQQRAEEELYQMSIKRPVTLAWRSTWLDQRAYHAVEADREPFRRGLFALLATLVIVAVARLIGVGLGLLTSPKIGVIQDQLLEAITGTQYFADLVARSPEFAEQFSVSYAAVWDLFRFAGGYPSFAGLGGSLAGLIFVLVSWFVYTSLTYGIARWFGSKAEYKRSLGIFALAYTPIMLTIVEMIPGASVAWTLTFLLIMVAKFLAAREAYKLGAGNSLAIVILPYVIGLLVLTGLLFFGAALGLSQIPYLDEILRTIRFAGFLGGL